MSFGATGFVVLLGLGLAVLVADVYAIVTTLRSSASDLMKVFWALLILFMPVLGLLIWLFAGPRN